MKSWYDHYVNRMNEHYRTHVHTKYNLFIGEIAREVMFKHDKLQKIAEIGCGAANITRLVHGLIDRRSDHCAVSQPEYLILDNCPQMLKLAQTNLAEADITHIARLGDARDLGRDNNMEDVNVFHSHGVLEHFCNSDICLIIESQMYNLAKDGVLIHYVPSAKYKVPSFGDERLLTPRQWREICEPDEVNEFNDGYDLILKWRKRG